MPKFLPTNWFKSMDLKDFDWNKYGSNNSKGCVLVVDLKDTKDLRKLNNNYPLAPDEREIKKEKIFIIFLLVL